ncbi:MAG: gliding motility-associated C-terminal domain-containing protein, partial [Bacteroidales bacterium]|nr:gliding motility-associated C-terminal domain-containing protein [Bacteroidales bacterium]
YVWHQVEYTENTDTATYRTLNAAGCDSVVTLHLTLLNCSTTSITACDSYSWHGQTYTTSDIYVDGNDTLDLTINYSSTGDTTIVACDSLTWQGVTYTESTTLNSQLSILNSAGCDSTVTLHLTINHSGTGDTIAVACDHFTWWYTDYTDNTDGITHTYTGPNGCDSVVTLHLTVNHSSTGDTTIVACDSLTWQGVTYTESTTLNSQLSTLNSAGCDSTITLHLTVNHSSTGDTTIVACDSFTWQGATYTESTTLNSQLSILNSVGCDSTVTLHLTINHSSTGDTTIVACDSLTWQGVTYTENTTLNSQLSILNSVGCDSTVTLHLTIRSSVTTYNADTVCTAAEWHGHTYYESDTLVYRTAGPLGCDSVDVLYLTVLQGPVTTIMVTACDSYDWYEYVNITASTDSLERRFPHPSGCDSVVRLLLTINHSDSATQVYDTACGGYQWNGRNYVSSGTYRYRTSARNGCDSIATLHLTIYPVASANFYDTVCEDGVYYFNGQECRGTGDYTATFSTVNGCDSLVLLHLFARPRVDVGIVVEYSCPQEEYRLTAATNGQLYTWSTQPVSHQLSGHEHDSEILLRPRDTMQLTLMMDYGEGRSCPNSDKVDLFPIHKVIAAMECHPEVLNRDRRTLTALDASTGHTDLAWYVDGTYWGNGHSIVCTAADEAHALDLTLVAFNDHCADTAHRLIQVVDESLYVPNVFTPSLSTNATFRAYGTGILEFRIHIYNREGLKVFEADDIEAEWDGTHDGTPCPQANYVYRIQYRGELVPDGWKSVTGSVLLLR